MNCKTCEHRTALGVCLLLNEFVEDTFYCANYKMYNPEDDIPTEWEKDYREDNLPKEDITTNNTGCLGLFLMITFIPLFFIYYVI